MVSVGINFQHKQKYSFEFSRSLSFSPSKETPNEDEGPSFDFGPINSYYGTLDEDRGYNLLIGRIIKPSGQQIFRFNLMAGLGFTEISNKVNHRLVRRSFLFTVQDSYEYDEHRFSTLSLILKPKIELIVGRYLGLNLFNQMTLNKDRFMVGRFGIELTYGILRGKKVKYNMGAN